MDVKETRKLFDLITNNKTVEAQEQFSHLMANKAVERLDYFKKQAAQALFNKKG